MKLRKLSLAIVILTSSVVVQAKQITVQVKGMVCAFCAQGIEKKLKEVSEISSVKVSLESKKVTLDTKEGKDITDERIKKIVTESGYDVVKIEREN